MPQLDTSTWATIILSMIITLFIIFQTKLLTHTFSSNFQTTNLMYTKHLTPWEEKWTKIYLPLLPRLPF